MKEPDLHFGQRTLPVAPIPVQEIKDRTAKVRQQEFVEVVESSLWRHWGSSSGYMARRLYDEGVDETEADNVSPALGKEPCCAMLTCPAKVTQWAPDCGD